MRVEDLIGLGDGMPVKEVLVRVSGIRKQYVGNGEWGVYSYQNGVAADNTGEIKILFKNRSDVIEAEGKLMSIKSIKGKKGLIGAVMGEDKEGNVEIQVTKGAEIMVLDDKKAPLYMVDNIQSKAYEQYKQPVTTQNNENSKSSGNGVQQSIERQNALKCATTIIASMTQGMLADVKALKGVDKLTEYVEEAALSMANTFYSWKPIVLEEEKVVEEETVVEEEEIEDF